MTEHQTYLYGFHCASKRLDRKEPKKVEHNVYMYLIYFANCEHGFIFQKYIIHLCAFKLRLLKQHDFRRDDASPLKYYIYKKFSFDNVYLL